MLRISGSSISSIRTPQIVPVILLAFGCSAGASSITGVVCGVRVEAIDDPLMQKIRYLDKLVDELAKGKAMTKVLRA